MKTNGCGRTQGEGISKETAEWVRGWAEKLPLQPCMRLMQHLLPQLELFCQASNVNDENTVVEFLRVSWRARFPAAMLLCVAAGNKNTKALPCC
jgi:hypothetical protein